MGKILIGDGKNSDPGSETRDKHHGWPMTGIGTVSIDLFF